MKPRIYPNLPESGHSWESTLSQLRGQLAVAVRNSDLFDSTVIDAFNRSGKTDGTYIITPGDPVLINNTKSFINILYSLEQLTPTIKAGTSYIMSEGFDSLMAAGQFGFRVFSDRDKIKQFITDIRALIFYLTQLTTTLKTLPAIDSTFIPLITEFKNALGNSLQPIVGLLQAAPENVDAAEKAELSLVAVDLQGVIVEFHRDAIPRSEDNATINFAKIYRAIDAINTKTQQIITAKYAIEPDEVTGVYAESADQDANKQNIIRAANIFANIRMALQKIDFNKSHVFEAMRDVGHAIEQLQRIDIGNALALGANELKSIIEAGMQAIEPILIAMARVAEITEIRLGLKNDALQAKLRELCNHYENFAKTLGMETQPYPYLEERLSVREQELKQKQNEYDELKRAKDRIEKADVSAHTSLHELLQLRDGAKKISSPQAARYVKEINKMIAERTGMSDLVAQIARQEESVRKTQDQTAIVELQRLYQLRHVLDIKIKAVAQDANITDAFSYDKVTKHIVTIALPVTSTLAASTRKSTRETAEAVIAGTKRECDRLQQLVAEVQDQIITGPLPANAVVKQPDEFAKLVKFKSTIEKMSPESLYTMPLSQLQEHINEVKQLQHPGTNAYVQLFTTALEERVDSGNALGREVVLKERVARDSLYIAEMQKALEKLNVAAQQLGSKESNEKAINALRNHSIRKNPLLPMNEKMADALAQQLNISTDGLIALQYAKTYWIFQYPLLKKMDEKIQELEKINEKLADIQGQREALERDIKSESDLHQKLEDEAKGVGEQTRDLKEKVFSSEVELDNLPTQKYYGTLLSTWEDAQQSVLQVIREKTLDLVPRGERKPHAMVASISTPVESTPFLRGETQEQLLERLEKQNKGSILVTIESARNKILQLVNTRYFDAKSIDEFKLSGNTYPIDISISDPLLIKNSKALLNLLARSEKLMQQIQGMVGNLSAGDYVGAVPDVEKVRTAARELVWELRDYAHYTNELGSSLANLSDPSQLASFTALSETAGPMLTSLKSWVSMPGISELMEVDLASNIDGVLTNLNAMAKEPTSPLKTTDLMQAAKSQLDSYIKEKGIEPKSNGLFSKKAAGSDPDLKNILIFANALTRIQRISTKLVVHAQSDTMRVKNVGKVIHNLFMLYTASKDIDTSRIPEIKTALKQAMEEAHRLLLDIVRNVESAELSLGLKAGLLTGNFEQFCRDFEKMAEKFGANLSTHYPYAVERISVFQQQVAEQDRKIAALRKIDGHSESLASLVATQDALGMLPPSQIASLMDWVNTLIAERTGLNKLNDKIATVKQSLSDFEKRMAQNENTLFAVKLQIREQETQKETLTHINANMLNGTPLSMHEIKFLHSLYEQKTPITFEKFCDLLIYQRALISEFTHTELLTITNHLASQKEKEKYLQTNLEVWKDVFAQKQNVLQEYATLHADLQQQISAIRRGENVDIKKYDNESEQLIKGQHTTSSSTMPLKAAESMEYVKGAIQSLEHKKAELEHTIRGMQEAQTTQIKTSLLAHQQQLLGLENTLGFRTGTLSGLVKTDVTDLAAATKEVYAFSHLRGLLTAIAHQDPHSTNKYAATLNAPSNPMELARSMKRQAQNDTSRLGRWFRKNIIGRPSVDDQIYAVANHYSNNERYKAAYEKATMMPTQETGISQHEATHSSAFIAIMELSSNDKNKALDALTSPPPAPQASDKHVAATPAVVAQPEQTKTDNEDSKDTHKLTH